MPMNIPTVKMFPLCVCEVFVKVHITNKVVLQNKIWACLYLILSVCAQYTVCNYLLCALFNSEVVCLPVHGSLSLLY